MILLIGIAVGAGAFGFYLGAKYGASGVWSHIFGGK